jgi:hypothetical protein
MREQSLVEQWWLMFAGWLAGWGGTSYLILFGALAACALAVLLVRWSAHSVNEEGQYLLGHGVMVAILALTLLAAVLMIPAVNARLLDAGRQLSQSKNVVEAYRNSVRALLGTGSH